MGIAAILLAAARCLWPGGSYLLGDEAALLQNAIAHNDAGKWAMHGLLNGHAPYGPLPTWLYQIGLAATGSLETIVVLKALFFGAAQLLFVKEVTRGFSALGRVAVVAFFLSPHFWIASRDLWDNSWLIPFAAIACTAYLRFSRRPGMLGFALVLATATAMLMTHLMAIPLVAGLLYAMATRQRAWLRGHVVGISVTVLGCLAFASPYLYFFFGALESVAAANTAHASPLRFLAGFGNAFLAPRIFQFIGSDFRLGLFWWRSFSGVGGILVPAAYLLSFVVIIAVWRGIYRLFRHAPSTDLALIAKVALPLHLLMSTVMRLGDFAHYFNALWPLLFLCLLLGVEDLGPRLRFRATVVGLASLSVAFVGMIVFLHGNAGSRSGNYGSDLAEWKRVVASLPSQPDVPVRISPELNAGAYAVVRRLRGDPESGRRPVPPRHEWLVRYRVQGRSWDAHLVAELVETAEPTL